MNLLQAKAKKDLDKELSSELPRLEEAIESKQFVAHANSILETESATDEVVNNYCQNCPNRILFTDGED